MAENSGIEWTNHTFNPVVGCTKVSPACDNCYAETWAQRAGSPELWTGKRRKTKTWGQPVKWNKRCAELGIRERVFCASLADVFDNQWLPEWRSDLWSLIKETPALDWLLLTKRPQNIAKMLPSDWDKGYPNVWLGMTAENQQEYDRRGPAFFRIPAVVHFLSIEPLLAPVHLRLATDEESGEVLPFPMFGPQPKWPLEPLDWVIAGGESGPGARPMHPDWARDLRDQCQAAGVPFFFKQWGEWAPGECAEKTPTRTERTANWYNDRWHYDSITPRASREMHRDDEPAVYRLGKKAAGNHLDGVQHLNYPKVRA
jgi:protein gp37